MSASQYPQSRQAAFGPMASANDGDRPLGQPFAPEAMVHLTSQPAYAYDAAPVLRSGAALAADTGVMPDAALGSGSATTSRPALRPDPEKRLAPKAVKVKPRHGLYAGAWGILGLIAGAYVFMVVLRQDGGPLLIARGDVDAAAVAKTQADVARLQQTVELLETDVARIKIDSAQADEREKQMAQRVAGVEGRVEQFSSQIAQAVAAPAANKVAKAAPATPPAAPAARIATGALPNVPPAAVQSPDTAAGVLLARGPSVDALRLSWSLLNERHKGTLKSFEPRVVEVEPGSFQLIAGPIANPAEAMKVCSTLKSRGVACQAADFKGSTL